MQLTEAQTHHRIDQEKKKLDALIGDLKLDKWLGWALSVIALIGAVVTALAGVHYAVPVALVGVPVFGVAKALVDSIRSKSTGSE